MYKILSFIESCSGSSELENAKLYAQEQIENALLFIRLFLLPYPFLFDVLHFQSKISYNYEVFYYLSNQS